MNFHKVVVKNESGLLESASRPLKNEYRVIYTPGVEIFPVVSNTKLFVFGDFEDACRFANQFNIDTQIWTCEVTNPQEIRYIPRLIDIEEYWKCFNAGIIKSDSSIVYGRVFYKTDIGISNQQHRNSYFVDSLKLTKLIKEGSPFQLWAS